MNRWLWMLAVLALGCGGIDRSAMTVFVTEQDAQVFRAFTSRIPFPIEVRVAKEPAKEVGSGKGVNVAVVSDGSCDGCFRVERTDERFVVKGGGALGMQYGFAHVL